MSFGPLQWIATYFLDILIKTVVLTLIFAVVTLGIVAPISLMPFAILLSVFHFVCLVFAAILMPAFERLRPRLSENSHFALLLLIANVPFVIGCAGLFGFGQWPGIGQLIAASCLAMANILAILIVAGCSRLFRSAR
jgi:hypothetical protein